MMLTSPKEEKVEVNTSTASLSVSDHQMKILLILWIHYEKQRR